MKSHDSDEDIEMDDILEQGEYEGLTKSDSVTFEDTVNNTLDDNSHSSDFVDDDDIPHSSDSVDDDDISHQAAHNLVNNEVEPSPPDVRQISTALALFRHRHNLSKSCINDLCNLLRCLGVDNVPTDFRAIARNITQNHENVLQGKKYLVCSTCGNKGAISTKCENVNCQSHIGFKETPTTLCTFKLLPQITSILERHKLLPETDSNNTRTTDVHDAPVRRNLILQERMLDPKKEIVTLLLNSDGVVLKIFSRSLWIACMVINELPRALRFNTNNIIICSVSVGLNKPKKTQFQSFIADWVHELRQLELGFYISSLNSNGSFVKVHAYLIAAALDKPAQALLLNINDPTGFYSCVRCTIKGKLVYIPSYTSKNL
jgi:hypothetical protein